MPQCEECLHEVDEGQKLCRHHSAKHQARRASRVEKVKNVGGKALLILLPIVVRRFRDR